MSRTPSAAHNIIRARRTVQNGNETALAHRSSSPRSSPDSYTGIMPGPGTTHNPARPRLSLPIVRRTRGRVY